MKSLIQTPSTYNTSALHRYIDRLDQEYKELRGSASMLYRKLIEVNFRFRMQSTFFASDHDLMKITGFCWRTLNRAKKILLSFGLIQLKASRGRGHATVYSLHPPKDFTLSAENSPKKAENTQKTANSEGKTAQKATNINSEKSSNDSGSALTIESLKTLKCDNPGKYNWEGFIRKMEEFNPSSDELKALVELSNYGEKGTIFWACCAEITKAKSTSTPIKQPVKFILSRYRHENN